LSLLPLHTGVQGLYAKNKLRKTVTTLQTTMSEKKKTKKEESSEEEESEEVSSSSGEEEEEETSTEGGDTSEYTSENEEAPPAKGNGDKKGSGKGSAEKKPAEKAPAKKEDPPKKGSEKKSASGSAKSAPAKKKGSSAQKKTVKFKELTFEVTVPAGPFTAGDSIQLHVLINNQSPKQVKSIQAWLREYKGKFKKSGGKVKRPKPKKREDTEQEYFQGARFPLMGHVSYEGDISFPLPKGLESSSNELAYDIVVNFDVSGIKWKHIPISIDVDIEG